jgi:hypothetical protein
MTDDVELRRLAIRRADMKLAFRSHLMSYVIVNAGLVVIYFMTSDLGDYFWPIWPMLGWGFGLAAHAFTVYMDGEGMRDRLIEQELEKLRRKG